MKIDNIEEILKAKGKHYFEDYLDFMKESEPIDIELFKKSFKMDGDMNHYDVLAIKTLSHFHKRKIEILLISEKFDLYLKTMTLPCKQWNMYKLMESRKEKLKKLESIKKPSI